MELHSSINWSSRLRRVISQTSSIPTDINFQIMEDNVMEELKAHKMILGMVSDVFLNMFFEVDTADKLATKIVIRGTSAPAFQIMLDAIYHIKPIKRSLEGKTVDEAFDVLDLVTRYQIPELVNDVNKHLSVLPLSEANVMDIVADAVVYLPTFQTTAHSLILHCAKFIKSVNGMLTAFDWVTNYPVTGVTVDVLKRLASMPLSDDNVMKVASKAVEFLTIHDEEAKDLLFNCAKFLKHKFTDVNSVFRFTAENEDQIVTVCKLHALMMDIPHVCHNCLDNNCQNGIEVKPIKYRIGLQVMKETDFKIVGNVIGLKGNITGFKAPHDYVKLMIDGQIINHFVILDKRPNFLFRCVR